MAFPIAKALKQQGANVYAGTSIYSNYLEWSRYLTQTFSHPTTDDGSDNALPVILNWLAQNPQIDLIQPVSESATRLIMRHRTAFERVAKLIMPSSQTVSTCSNKGEMFRLCSDLEIPLAKYEIVDSRSSLLAASENIGFPLIVKPSNVDAELFGRKAIIANSRAALLAVFTEWPDAHTELIVQKFVKGPRQSVIFSAQNGRLIKAAAITALRTHEQDGTGYTTLGVTVRPRPEVKAATERLVEALDYSFTGCAQFIVDPESDEITFMELNPRTSLARISEAAGVHHSILGLQQALGRAVQICGDAWDTKIGTRYVWTKGDLMRLKRNLALGPGNIWNAIRELPVIGWDAIRSHHAIFDPLDPMPAVGTYLNPIISQLRTRQAPRSETCLA
jgi:predicted ATP-grasp superfamily ATP-dependent carboligase